MENEQKQQRGRPQAKVTKEEIKLIRILGKDIYGDKKMLVGLTAIKGISLNFSNVICEFLKFDKKKLIGSLSDDDVKRIENFVRNPPKELPDFLLNRQKDFDSGDNLHITGNDLDLRIEFDLKRLKKIKSYKGVRHNVHLPVRGQRTKSHFRRNRRKSGSTGIKKK